MGMFLSKTFQLYLYWKSVTIFKTKNNREKTGSLLIVHLEPKMHLPFVHRNNNKKKIIIAKVPV